MRFRRSQIGVVSASDKHLRLLSYCACPHGVRTCSFRGLVIFTRFLQNACRLSSFFFVLCCPTGGENQYAVSSSTFALAASRGGELRILLLGLFVAPGRRKRQRVPLTRSVHAKPRLLPNRSDVAQAYSSFFKTTPLCLCALPSPSLPPPSHPRRSSHLPLFPISLFSSSCFM